MSVWSLNNLDNDDRPTLINNVETLAEALSIFGFTEENDTDWSIESTARDNRWFLFRATDKTEYVLIRRNQ